MPFLNIISTSISIISERLKKRFIHLTTYAAFPHLFITRLFVNSEFLFVVARLETCRNTSLQLAFGLLAAPIRPSLPGYRWYRYAGHFACMCCIRRKRTAPNQLRLMRLLKIRINIAALNLIHGSSHLKICYQMKSVRTSRRVIPGWCAAATGGQCDPLLFFQLFSSPRAGKKLGEAKKMLTFPRRCCGLLTESPLGF